MLLCLLRSKAGRVHPAHLAGADAYGLAVGSVNQGIGLDILGDLPGKAQSAGLALRGRSLGHHLPLFDIFSIIILEHHAPEDVLLVESPVKLFFSGQKISYVQDSPVGLFLHEHPQRLGIVSRRQEHLHEAVANSLGRVHIHRPVESDHPAEGGLGISGEGELIGPGQAGPIGHAAGIGVLDYD